MYGSKKVFGGRRTHEKKLFAAGAVYKKLQLFGCENFLNPAPFSPSPRQKNNGPSFRGSCFSPTAQAGEVEATEVVLIGALRTDNMNGPVLNSLNVLLGLLKYRQTVFKDEPNTRTIKIYNYFLRWNQQPLNGATE